MSYRILLVDDEPDILEFVGYNLSKAGYRVFTARNGREGVEAACRHRPHLILLDRMMPEMDGVETCRAIRRISELDDTRIVFLSALGEEEHQITGFDVGADDYLTKPIKMKVMLSRVQAILKRIAPDDGLAPHLDRDRRTAQEPDLTPQIDRDRHTVRVGLQELDLPRKEFSLLALLQSAPGRLFTREEIYRAVWGSEVVVGDRTIDVHIRRLRSKVGAEHIVTLKGLGYKWED